MDATADWLPLAQPPAGLPVPYGALKPKAGTDCLIGSEIITYAAVNASSPVGLSGVTRGAYNTTAAAHPAGATIYLMTQVYGGFLPDPSTDMLAEVGANIARAYNSAGMDMICKIVMRSRFAVLSVSLTRKASPLQHGSARVHGLLQRPRYAVSEVQLARHAGYWMVGLRGFRSRLFLRDTAGR